MVSQRGGQQLNFAIRAVNEAKRALDEVNGQLTGVETKSKNVDRALSGLGGSLRSSGGEALKFATAFTGIYVGILGVAQVAGRTFRAFVTDAVKGASDISESQNKAQVIFGDFTDTIDAFSLSSAKAAGLSRQQAIEASASFGNMFRTIGLGQKVAADMSVRLSQLASDMASFNNEDPSDMLLRLRSGLAGEAEPLRRFGVLLSEERVKLEGVRLGLVKTGQELTEQQKVQARYSLILRDSAIQQGDFARTSDGLANQQRTLAANILDLQAKIGERLLPKVLEITKAINNWIDTKGDQFVDDLGAAAARASETVSALARDVQNLANSGPVQIAIDIFASHSGDDVAFAIMASVLGFAVGGPRGAIAAGGIAAAGVNLGHDIRAGLDQRKAEILNEINILTSGRRAGDVSGKNDSVPVLDPSTGRALSPLDLGLRRQEIPGESEQDLILQNLQAAGHGIESFKQRVDRAGTAAETAAASAGRLSAAESALANARERITNDVNDKLIQAYLRGGDALLATVRAQQEGVLDKVNNLADEITQHVGVDLPTALTAAYEHLTKRVKRSVEELDRLVFRRQMVHPDIFSVRPRASMTVPVTARGSGTATSTSNTLIFNYNESSSTIRVANHQVPRLIADGLREARRQGFQV